ncbi:MAG: hypothetical protein JW863_23010 [Chitinispirillaceae bacterium]|nr:hypothetical protein [Chitinispirillaceae bacterium]
MHSFSFSGSMRFLFTSAIMLSAYGDIRMDYYFDDAVNDLDYQWFYYDDYRSTHPTDRPQAAPSSTPSVIDVPYIERNRYAFGDTTDTIKIKNYNFSVTESSGKRCATMPFTMGNLWETSYCNEGTPCAMPYVGIATMLAAEGSGINLSDVDSIHFFIKSRVQRLTEVWFMVQTLDIEQAAHKPADHYEDGEYYGYYGKYITIEPGYWQEFSIAVEDLDLPGTWAVEYDFDITMCTKLSWEIKGDGEISRDTIDIADVYLGSDWPVKPSLWSKTEDSIPSYNPDAAIPQVYFTFDGSMAMMPVIEWSVFSDKECGGSTKLDPVYISGDAEDGDAPPLLLPETGSDGKGNGITAGIEFGGDVSCDTFEYPPYAGIEMNCYDSVGETYWDVLSNGSDGTVYFQYKTEGIFSGYLRFEVFDRNDVADTGKTSRPRSRGTFIPYFLYVPSTEGSRRTVRIPFDQLVTRSNPDGHRTTPLDLHNIAKFQWKTYGEDGGLCRFSIDNIYFPGLNFTTHALKEIPAGATIRKQLFIGQSGNLLVVNWDATARISRGYLRIIDLKGKELFCTTLPVDGSSHLKISATGFPPGTYLFELENTGTGREPVIMRARGMILR